MIPNLVIIYNTVDTKDIIDIFSNVNSMLLIKDFIFIYFKLSL
jgi:hypothetical protein